MSTRINFLLVLVVVFCPLWCAAGSTVWCAAEEDPVKRCCCLPQPDSPQPAPQPEGSQSCLCSGAIVADPFQLESGQQILKIWMVEVCAPDSSEWRFEQTIAHASPDPPGHFGRSLRHRLMSLTL